MRENSAGSRGNVLDLRAAATANRGTRSEEGDTGSQTAKEAWPVQETRKTNERHQIEKDKKQPSLFQVT